MNTEFTLAWLGAHSAAALEAARAGDPGPANRLAAHPALHHYFVNVHARRAMTPAQWSQVYPQHLREAERLREEAERAAALEARLAALEKRLDRLVSQSAPQPASKKLKS